MSDASVPSGEVNDVAESHTESSATQPHPGSPVWVGLTQSAMEHLAWPLMLGVVLVWLRREVRRVLAVLRKRIRDPRSKVAIGGDGVTIEAAEGKLETLQEQIEQLKILIVGRTASQTPEKELDELAANYMTLDKIEAWRERVAKKDVVGRQMGALIYQHGLDRAALAQSGDEAKVLGVAHAAMLEPRGSDLTPLLVAAKSVRRLHVKYAIAMAIGRFAEHGMLQSDDVAACQAGLRSMLKGADDSLRRRIDRSLAQLNASG